MSLFPAARFFGPELRQAVRLLDEPFFRHAAPALGRFVAEGSRPAIDLRETEAGYTIEAEVPGYRREEIKVEFSGEDNRTLVITGETKPIDTPNATSTDVAPTESAIEASEGTTWLSERHRGAFHRSFRLPAAVDVEQVKAKMNDGVLSLVLPKVQKQAPRSISVE